MPKQSKLKPFMAGFLMALFLSVFMSASGLIPWKLRERFATFPGWRQYAQNIAWISNPCATLPKSETWIGHFFLSTVSAISASKARSWTSHLSNNSTMGTFISESWLARKQEYLKIGWDPFLNPQKRLLWASRSLFDTPLIWSLIFFR